jgi:hypothetical protein
MTTIDVLQDRLFKKLKGLEPDQLRYVIDFVDFLIFRQNTNRVNLKPKVIENRTALVEEMKQLLKETQALAGVSEITDDEIAEEIAAYRRGE